MMKFSLRVCFSILEFSFLCWLLIVEDLIYVLFVMFGCICPLVDIEVGFHP
jgi:hypothetical protein